MTVPAHLLLLQRSRVGRRRRHPGSHRNHRLRPGCAGRRGVRAGSDVGATVAAGDRFSEVESTKSVSDIYAPVSGTVVAVNDALDDGPEALNSDPYGAGWICEIEMSDPADVDGLLDAVGYQALIDG